MKMVRLVVYAALFFSVYSGTSQAEAIASTFDVDEEGWILTGGALTWIALGGNPDGYLETDDTVDSEMLLHAPPAFLGDLSRFNYGSVSFDAIEVINPDEPWSSFGEITITGPAGSASLDITDEPLSETWVPVQGYFSAAEWGVSEDTWRSILQNVTEITINIESGSEVSETVGIDNITFETERCDFNVDGVFDREDVFSFFLECRGSSLPEWNCDRNFDGAFNTRDLISLIKRCAQQVR